MKKIKNLSLFLILILLSVSLIACGPKDVVDEDLQVEDIQDVEETEDEVVSNYPMEVEDKFGNKETIEEEPMKIVSLAPSNTEILFALGLGNKVVGVTSNCDYPEEAASKEIVGDYTANLEKIIELEPDLVLVYGSGDPEEIKILKDTGIKVLGFMPETIDEVMADINTIGEITGSSEKAKNLTSDMENKKDEIVKKVKDQERPKVFYEIWHEPLMAAGKGSFMDELITLAGGENIAEDADGPYPEYDLEQLVERNPEVYLTSADLPEKDIESIKTRPGYEEIHAIKNDKVYIFEDDEANVVSRPGPRIVEALELVAKAIHPKLFE